MALIRNCDYCGAPAIYDAKSDRGYWAYMCEEHYELHGHRGFSPTVLANVTAD